MKSTAGGVLMFLLGIAIDVMIILKLRFILPSASLGYAGALVLSLFALFPAGLYLFSAPFQEKVDGLYKKRVKRPMLYWFITFFALMTYTTYAVDIASVLQGWTLLPLNIILDFVAVAVRNRPPQEQI